MISDDFAGGIAPRPRILVCAPSNAAIDELLERILRYAGVRYLFRVLDLPLVAE